ncbi:hypothetical protein KA977_06985 [Candidatus Dependentiae bacterium]|nr:hypothetical protein [Candidatus Dependentiae bacterium]
MMKISDEAVRALEMQIESYKNRISTYNISIEKLSKMPENEVVKKSIDGYKKQVEFLKEKIFCLESDLVIIKKIREE